MKGRKENGKARLFVVGMVGLMLVGLLCMWTQNVEGQQLKATVEVSSKLTSPATNRIKPLSENAIYEITITYSYPPMGAIGIQSIQPTKITIKATPEGDAANWCVATLDKEQVYAEVKDPDGGSVTKTVTLTVYLTAEAPAFVQAKIRVDAIADKNSNLEGDTGSTTPTVIVGYYSLIQATIPETLKKGSPYQQIIYPVTVTNLGNGRTKIFFDAKNIPARWQITLPAPIILESRQQGGKLTSQTVNVVIFTPYKFGYQTDVGSIKIDVTSTSAEETTIKGDSTSINTLTLSKGFYMPSFDLIIIMGAIGTATIFFKRR